MCFLNELYDVYFKLGLIFRIGCTFVICLVCFVFAAMLFVLVFCVFAFTATVATTVTFGGCLFAFAAIVCFAFASFCC